jgi:hypothetical protein
MIILTYSCVVSSVISLTFAVLHHFDTLRFEVQCYTVRGGVATCRRKEIRATGFETTSLGGKSAATY